jgi:hypothetical protein
MALSTQSTVNQQLASYGNAGHLSSLSSYLNILAVPMEESALGEPVAVAFSSVATFFSPPLEPWRLAADKLAKGLLPGPKTVT